MVACGAPSEEDIGPLSQPIATETVYVDRRPCTGCAERIAAQAAAEAQALRRAMKEAEAAARAKRLAEAKVKACIAQKDRALAACNNGVHAAAADAARTRATCMFTNPCRVGGSGTRSSTCVLQGARVCTNNLNWCLDGIPFGAPGIEANIIGNAVANCNAAFGTPCSEGSVVRACQGLGNFGGFGTKEARCEGYLQENCAEPEAHAIARAHEMLGRCTADAWINESFCLGNPTLEMH